MVRQTVFLVIAAIGLVLLSVLVIIPGVIRFLGGSSAIVEVDDSLPPQTPILAAPVTATFSATLSLSGFTTKNSEVIFLKNGQQDQTAMADDGGNFTAEMSLEKGENLVTAYAKKGDQESGVSEQYTILFDDEKPLIELEEPKENQSIQGKKSQMVAVKGKTEPSSRLTLNDRLIFVTADGTFSTSHRLENGENVLNFRSVDAAGNTTEKQIKVSFSE